ncbi:MAG: flagellar basal body L-ring protein FlgH [Deltaproteobacteria bacterium]|jgi:flagellar L-ring protein precursor FlgH|nr:flagellar basal body L-ring protein FlgH [Deltaproteobacteria bacterium]
MKKIISLSFALLVASLAFGFTGCSKPLSSPSPLANQEAALINPPVSTYPQPAIKTEGSLFSEDSRPEYFSDMKAKRVGDIITINIVETSKASKTANTSTGRSNSLQVSTNTLFGLENSTAIPQPGGFSLMKGVDASYGGKFSGTGSTSRNENITAKISARIIQVLPNHNLVVRGSQEILVNNEKQFITVQGVVRPADVATDNSVLSTYMADARIEYTGQGDLTNKQREGWLSRALDKIWPF